MKEIIKLEVKVTIEYEKDNSESRKRAVRMAKSNVTSCSTLSYPECSNPRTAKLIK